jgi:signal transduction histidine kinase
LTPSARARRTVRAVEAVLQLARVPRRPPPIDIAIAGGLLVWALAEAIFAEGSGPTWARIVVALCFTVPLVWRRRAPATVLLVLLATLAFAGIAGHEPETGAMPFPSLLVAGFSGALYARTDRLAIATSVGPAAGVLMAMALGYFSGAPTPTDYAILLFLSAGAWAGGWLVRRRAAQLEQARADAPELAREAVAAERARVARELHDVVAHSVSIIAVQAGAAEALLDQEPDAARPHVATVRQTAHDALVELRRLVGVLREDEPTYVPQPGLERLRELVDDARAAGLDVDLREEGTRPAVPLGVDLAAYRIVQEGLTNVRRHAEGSTATVLVRYAPAAIQLEVANGPGASANGTPGTGHGIIGMRERARLYGGTFDAGPRPDGGFRVSATLPLEGSG